jgi:hypothetical protein
MEEQDVYAYAFEGKRYDAGTTMGWLKASVELALERPDLGPEFRTTSAASTSDLTAPTSAEVAALGDALPASYRLELLGQGGMATIYRATDAQLGRDVAVKVLRAEYGRDPAFVARFRQEASRRPPLKPPERRQRLRLRHGADGTRTSSWS